MTRVQILPLACALIVGIAAGLATSLALAAEKGTAPRFESLDKDADGRVSVNEAAAHDRLFVAFESLDRDRDGVLTREEFARFEREPG